MSSLDHILYIIYIVYYYKRTVKSTNTRKEGEIKGVSQERKHNGQREKDKRITIHKTLLRQLNMEQYEPH